MTTAVDAWGTDAADAPLRPMRVARRHLGPRDVLVRVWYCGLCHSDIHHARDEWGGARYPLVPGHEIVGCIEASGLECAEMEGDVVAVGTYTYTCGRPTCSACSSSGQGGQGGEQHCPDIVWTYDCLDRDGELAQGGYSTHIVVDADYVTRLPSALCAPELLPAVAPLLCAGLTVYGPLRRWLPPADRQSRTLLIAGLGGLGHLALRLAVHMGYTAVDVCSTGGGAKRAYALANGARAFLTAAELESAAYDVVLDTISCRHDVSPFLRGLRLGGALVFVGLPPDPVELDVMQVASRSLVVTGSIVGSRGELADMLDLCGRHGVVADVEVVPMAYVNTAFERVLANDVHFRFVLDCLNTFVS
jgi:uncharacterized zinc-type alcohol dehydrogenase-like protein